MKKSIFTVLAVLCSIIISSSAWGQAPEKFNYQAVLRDNGNVMVSQSVNVRFTIHDGSATGTNVYQETQFLTTDQYGRVNCAVDGGTVISGDFSTIDWGNGGKYLQVEIDNGSGFEDLGASQLLSVPYAIQAGGLDNAFEGWALDGNAATGTDFIGTTNGEDLRFKVDGFDAGFIGVNASTALGKGSLDENTTGLLNTAIGSHTLTSNTSGSRNTALGRYGISASTISDNNTSVGYGAMRDFTSTTSAGLNTALGYMTAVEDDLINATAVGSYAMVEQNNSMVLGSIDGVNNATANTRVGIGTTTPNHLLDVNGSVGVEDTLFLNGPYIRGDVALIFPFMEVFTTSFAPTSNFGGVAMLGSSTTQWGSLYVNEIFGRDNGLIDDNTLVIKTPTIVEMSATGTAGNTSGFMIKNLGNSSNPASINFQVGQNTNTLYMYDGAGVQLGRFDGTSGAYTSTSDERLKTNFQEVEGTLEKLMKLKPLTYTYINNSDNDRRHLGFKAQEVEKLFPTLVNSPKNADSDSEDGAYTMDYSGFGVIAVKAIQEQQVEIETLKEQNESLQNQIEEIKKQLEALSK